MVLARIDRDAPALPRLVTQSDGWTEWHVDARDEDTLALGDAELFERLYRGGRRLVALERIRAGPVVRVRMRLAALATPAPATMAGGQTPGFARPALHRGPTSGLAPPFPTVPRPRRRR